MQEKNKLLNELLTKQKQTINNNNTQHNTKTFAEVLTNTKTINKRIPKLIVKKTNSADETNLENTVIKYITTNKSIQTKNVIKRNKDTIIINCMNVESVNSIERTLSENLLADNFKVEKEQIKKPIVKIIDIDKIFKSDKEIEDDINERNFKNFDEKCKVLHIFSNAKTASISAILEVTSAIYKHIRENKNRLFVGYQNCRVFDIINTTPCSSCARFGHSAKKCPNQATCYKCAGNHKAAVCESETLKCPNCVFHNTKYNLNYDINHSAIDSDKCQILKNKINKYIEMTDYPMRPTYQRYFGKIERPTFQRSVTTIRRPRTANTATRGMSTSASSKTLTQNNGNNESKS